ncbi:MAG: helix-turn-helix transcriptional regulator [Alphaproteobacteria bacterium]|nr:helix-turn-helix transcriptional regulator [Alphaproteobacteria bacterium]
MRATAADLEALAERLSRACAQIGTKRQAAQVMGVSEDMVHRYCRAETKPPFLPLATLARAAGVRLDWLAYGEGAMLQGEEAGAPALALDVRLLVDVVETLEATLRALDLDLPPDTKARAVPLLYQYALVQPSTDNRLRFTRDLVESF